MMRTFQKLVLLVTVLLAQNVFAAEGGGGSVAGNGGDALVCDNGEVQFFDIFEAESVHKLKVDLGPDLTAFEKVEFAIDRIPNVLSFWRLKLLQRFELFKKRSVIGDFDLIDIPDSDNVILKPGCRMEQAVIQRKPVAPDDPIFLISQKYWDRMDETSKAALILHEIIYYDAILNRHTNSRVTRAVNAFVMAGTTPVERSCLIARTMIAGELGNVLREFQLGRMLVDANQAAVTEDCRVSNGHVFRGTIDIGSVVVQPITTKHPQFWQEMGVDGVSLKDPTDIQLVQVDTGYRINANGYEIDLAYVRTPAWNQTRFWQYGNSLNEQKNRPGYVYFGPNKNVLSASVERAVIQLFRQSVIVRGELNFFAMSDRIESIFFVPAGSVTIAEQKIAVSRIEHVGEHIGQAYRIFVPAGKKYTITTERGDKLIVDSQNPLVVTYDGKPI